MQTRVALDRVVFGGSFNPPHRGHLGIVHHVLEQKIAQNLSLVPNAISPFKLDQPPEDATHRLQMLELLLQDLPEKLQSRVQIEKFEIERPPPSFTINTLKYLQRLHPVASLGLLLGADSIDGLEHWHHANQLLTKFPLIVLKRPETNTNNRLAKKLYELYKTIPSGPLAGYRILNNTLLDCSSTEIRIIWKKEKSRTSLLAACLPENILQYISTNDLYLD